MEISAPIAILLASAMSIASGIVSGIIVRNHINPRKKNRIRTALVADIHEMDSLMRRSGFAEAIRKIRTREWKNFPRVIDANLPQETTHKLLHQNFDIFSDREIALLHEYFRRLKASRSFCLALYDTSMMEDDQVRDICDAAENEWQRVKSTAETILKEVSID